MLIKTSIGGPASSIPQYIKQIVSLHLLESSVLLSEEEWAEIDRLAYKVRILAESTSEVEVRDRRMVFGLTFQAEGLDELVNKVQDLVRRHLSKSRPSTC